MSGVYSLVMLGRADNGDGFWQHQLVGAVSVKINTGEESRLSRVSLKRGESDKQAVREREREREKDA